MDSWPGSLPTRPLEDAYEETWRDSQVRSSIEGMPLVQRQRSPGYSKSMSVTFEFTNTQLEAFQSFYRTTLGFGAIPFSWTHPRTGASIRARFIGGQSPKHSAIGYDTYHSACMLEVMP